MYKKSRSASDNATYKQLRKDSKTSINVDYDKFNNSTQYNLMKNVRSLWSYVRSKRDVRGYPRVMTYGDSSADWLILLIYLPVIFSRFISSMITYQYRCPDMSLSYIAIDSDIVFKKLIELDKNKGAGPDKLPPVFFFNCSPTLAMPLSYIYNISLKSGTFPSMWKLARITPLFKCGNRRNISDYRPISGLDTAAKVLEKIVTENLFDTFRNRITISQHGFFTGRSCQTNLCIFTHYLATSLDQGSQVDVIYLDYRKAFDQVSHQILIEKLKFYGICDPLLTWFRSYLEGRRQIVAIGSTISNEFNVCSGVPQGSHLGPILFLIFINDLSVVFKTSHFLFFADDLKVYHRIKSVNDCRLLQEDIKNITSWCLDNKMELNISKCKFMTFTRKKLPILHSYFANGQELSRVSIINDLGVLFDSELRFTGHIDWVISKSFRMLGFVLRQCHDFRDTEVLKLIFYSLVRSHLDYCCAIWSPCYRVHICRLERVQMKFVNFLLYKLRIDKSLLSHSERLGVVGLDSLEVRRNKLTLSFGHKILTARIDCRDLLSLLNCRVPS